MLSGIGAPDELRALGIPPAAPAPRGGPGPSGPLRFLPPARLPATDHLLPIPQSAAPCRRPRRVPVPAPGTPHRVPHGRGGAHQERQRPGTPGPPDLPVSHAGKPIREGRLWPRSHGFNLHWNVLRPESRGGSGCAARIRSPPRESGTTTSRRKATGVSTARRSPGAGRSWPTTPSLRSGAGRRSRAGAASTARPSTRSSPGCRTADTIRSAPAGWARATMRSSTPACGCADSRGCGWRTHPSCRGSSAATPMPPPSDRGEGGGLRRGERLIVRGGGAARIDDARPGLQRRPAAAAGEVAGLRSQRKGHEREAGPRSLRRRTLPEGTGGK